MLLSLPIPRSISSQESTMSQSNNAYNFSSSYCISSLGDHSDHFTPITSDLSKEIKSLTTTTLYSPSTSSNSIIHLDSLVFFQLHYISTSIPTAIAKFILIELKNHDLPIYHPLHSIHH